MANICKYLQIALRLLAVLLLSTINAMATPLALHASCQADFYPCQEAAATEQVSVHFAARGPPLTTSNIAFTGAAVADYGNSIIMHELETRMASLRFGVGLDAPNNVRTDFVDGVTVTDIRTGQTFTGTVDLRPTLNRIDNGIPHPHRNDGSTFRNNEGLLPSQPDGYYTEFVHPTPGINGPGPQRIIQGQGGELYYTSDHYGSFVPLN
jgi:hypothetical protein